MTLAVCEQETPEGLAFSIGMEMGVMVKWG